ncbi:MAG: hypothetical protein OEQ28_13450 [Acidobacteriota bacterium]|nr:hypothetical protein [Acidobacteriota bacterium]
MKLRLRGNSLRLRLSVSEVERLRGTGEVSDAIIFGPGMSDRLVYAIEIDGESDSLRTRFDGNRITVKVPHGIAREWVDSDSVGFAADQDANGGGRLKILVEKDLACLKIRPGEDESDSFPNPEAGVAC